MLQTSECYIIPSSLHISATEHLTLRLRNLQIAKFIPQTWEDNFYMKLSAIVNRHLFLPLLLLLSIQRRVCVQESASHKVECSSTLSVRSRPANHRSRHFSKGGGRDGFRMGSPARDLILDVDDGGWRGEVGFIHRHFFCSKVLGLAYSILEPLYKNLHNYWMWVKVARMNFYYVSSHIGATSMRLGLRGVYVNSSVVN